MSWGGGEFSTYMNEVIPGTYVNITVTPKANITYGERGYLAMPMELPWGADGEVFTVTASDYSRNAKEIFGYNIGSEELRNVDEIFKNAKVVHFYRLNSNGEKAKGNIGTAKCSGELGNGITVVVEENPDYLGEYEPSAIISKTADKEYNVYFLDIGSNKPEVKFIKKETEEDVEAEGNYTITGSNPVNIKILDTLGEGNYQIKANLDGVGTLATQDVVIPHIYIPTATISVEEALKQYKVTYDELGDYEKIVLFQKRLDSSDVDTEKYETSSDETSVTLTIKDTLEPGEYKIVAKTSRNGVELDTEDVDIPEPTAEISEVTLNEEYKVQYSNLRGYTMDVKVQTSLGVDVDTGDYTVETTADSTTIKIKEEFDAGSFKIIAKTNYNDEELDTQEFTIPAPTAEISEIKVNEEYKVQYTNLRAYTMDVKVQSNLGVDVVGTDYTTETTEDSTTIKIKKEFDAGSFKIIARTDYNGEDLATKDFTIPAPTAEISEEEANKKYVVTYENLRAYSKLVTVVTDPGAEEVNKSKYNKTEEESKTTVEMNDTIEAGNYKIVAKSSYSEDELDSQTFTIPAPTATWSQEEENKKYKATYQNLGPYTMSAKVYTNPDGTEVDTSKYTVTDASDDATKAITVEFNTTCENGTYDIKAFSSKDPETPLATQESVSWEGYEAV